MNQIQLHFVEKKHLDILLVDKEFFKGINYLKPNRIDENYILLTDPVEEHHHLDTEIVVLSKFARIIKEKLYSDTKIAISFLNPILGESKNGLAHDTQVIIDTTRIKTI